MIDVILFLMGCSSMIFGGATDRWDIATFGLVLAMGIGLNWEINKKEQNI